MLEKSSSALAESFSAVSTVLQKWILSLVCKDSAVNWTPSEPSGTIVCCPDFCPAHTGYPVSDITPWLVL